MILPPPPATPPSGSPPSGSPPRDPQAPPEAVGGGELVLVPPAPVAAVSPARAEPAVPVDPDTARRLAAQAAAFADTVVEADPNAPNFTSRLAAIQRMGAKEVRDSAAMSSRLLDKPTRAMDSGAFDPTSKVSSSLVELRRVVTDLDPSRQALSGPKKVLGLVPYGNRMRDYFASYQSSQAQLDAVLRALAGGQEELRRDNAAIDQEKHQLWATMGQLRSFAYLAESLDAELTGRIERIEFDDPDRARALREDVLFAVRQRRTDLLTQLAVATQGYLALDLVRKNNLELVKGVERARTTTVAALRTAVVVAQALANQKLVLDQISALTATTERMISATADMLSRNSAAVYQQASSSTVSLETLRAAFESIYTTIDAIDGYKAAALDTLRTTADSLSTEIGRANAYVERAAATAANAVDRGGDELGLGTAP